jgi:DNA-binding Lrp family transcriptional regulator
MVAKAYVLIEAQVGRTKEVVEAIQALQGVVSVDSVTGPYDAIAVIEAETVNDIGALIVEKMHPVAGISRTVTCLVF